MQNKIREYYQKFSTTIQSLDKHPSLEFFERQHKILIGPKLLKVLKYLIPLILIIFPFQIFTIIFGFIYPTYLTIKTFQTPNQQGQNRILTYWIMFVFTQIFTPIPQLIISSFTWYILRVLILWIMLTGRFGLSKKFQQYVLLPLVKQIKSQKSEIQKKQQ